MLLEPLLVKTHLFMSSLFQGGENMARLEVSLCTGKFQNIATCNSDDE
jgi:hypothetical protein